MQRLPRITAAVGGAVLVAIGLWALVDPRSFYDSIATYPPYNRHFLHDIGAFNIGLGATLLACLRVSKALAVALIGNAVAAALHAFSHIVDSHLGGRSADPVLFTVVAFVLAMAAAQALKERR